MNVSRKTVLTTAIAVGCLAIGVAQAAQPSDAQIGAVNATASNEVNPYVLHSSHHGVIPTVDRLKAARDWAAAHHGASANNINSAETANAVAPWTGYGDPTLVYQGGGAGGVGVMSGPVQVYIVFWGTQWGNKTTDASGDAKFSGDADGAASAVQEMFKGIGTNNELWQADLTQWCDGPNVAAGATSCPANANFIPYQKNIMAGVWYDNGAASPSSATAAQIAQEAVNAAAHFGNTTAASNRYSYYIILSPKGTNPDNYQGQYCAYHDSTSAAGVNSPYGEIAYSNQPYNMDSGAGCGVGFVNNPGTLDGYTMTLGHEWHEMMSDTFFTSGSNSGWYSTTWGSTAANQGGENSDECAWIAPGQAGGAQNIAFGTGTFAEQGSWSNDTQSCALSHAIVNHGGGGTPAASFTDSVSGLAVTFTDTSTDNGGTISSHSWTFGDGGTSTATSPSHTYASAGTYSVAETVTDSANGKTSTATHSVTVSNPGGTPTANFGFSTNGLTATFTDSSTDSGGSISAHSWTFGDGGTSTTASPSHTYAAAGTYSVTEKVTDSVSGKTSSKTASVTVSSGGTPTQLFGNTGFESGAASPWTMSSGTLCTSSCGSESAHSGSWFAWLDGYGSAHTDTVSQSVTITAGKSKATLQYYLHIDTAETGTTAYDTLTVGVYNSSGTLLKTLATYSNVNAASGYAVHTNDVSAYIGQTVTIKFTGTEDSSNQTSFVLDDVTLTVQ